jgi:hypothetical protein
MMVPGATLDGPHRGPCGQKPQAVLVNLEAVVPGNGAIPDKIAGVLGALETFDVILRNMTARTGPDTAEALTRFGAAGLRRPDPGSAVLAVAGGSEPAARATVGTAYRVIAIIGSRVDDFPNKAPPASAGPPVELGQVRRAQQDDRADIGEVSRGRRR